MTKGSVKMLERSAVLQLYKSVPDLGVPMQSQSNTLSDNFTVRRPDCNREIKYEQHLRNSERQEKSIAIVSGEARISK